MGEAEIEDQLVELIYSIPRADWHKVDELLATQTKDRR